MKKEFFCAHEYRTPVCKVVPVHFDCNILQGSKDGVVPEADYNDIEGDL